MRFPRPLCAFLLCGIAVIALQLLANAQDWAQVRTGTLTYPAQDNLDTSEGTIECWIQLRFDPATGLPAKAYTGFASFLQMEGESGSIQWIYQAQAGDKQASWYASCHPETRLAHLFAKATGWKKGEWHHFAFVWRGKETVLYLDGAEAVRHSHDSSLFLALGAVKGLSLGGKWNTNAVFAIDDFRVSRVARRPEELGFHGVLKADVFTSILDQFDEGFTPDGRVTTKASVMLSGSGGLATPPCEFVPGKFGQALSFYKP